jgi:toxin YhaV
VDPSYCQSGWNVYFHPLFDRQLSKLTDEVKACEARVREGKLSTQDFQKHPKAKMLAALKRAYSEEIPSDPNHNRFRLNGALREYKRLKKLGLDSRYRLFFKPFSGEKAIVIIWLGYPRKQGDRQDCYEQFKKMISRSPNTTLEELLDACF